MKTKLMLASFAMVVLMVAAVGAGTLAYFSDTETVEDNTFTAGTVDMCVEVPGDVKKVTTTDHHVLLKPCEVGYLTEEIINTGNNPIHVWKHTLNVEDFGGLNPEPEMTFCLNAVDSECSGMKMSKLIEYDLAIDGVQVIYLDDGYTLANINCCWLDLGVLEPKESITVTQSYHLRSDASNAYQGDFVEFDMEFLATQTVGEAPGPSPMCGY